MSCFDRTLQCLANTMWRWIRTALLINEIRSFGFINLKTSAALYRGLVSEFSIGEGRFSSPHH